jgi:regulatory protein
MKNNYTPNRSIERLRGYFVFLLARREYSEKELVKKSIEKEYDQDDIESVIEEFKEKNLQSDQRYSEAFIRQQLSQLNGINKIKNKAFDKGISNELLEDAFQLYFDENKTNWINIATEFVIKKHGAFYYKSDFKEQQKMKNQLMNKGFSYDEINELF